MGRVSPVEMRKVMEIVNSMKMGGIGFVPVPYTNEKEKRDLQVLLKINIDKLDIMARGEDDRANSTGN